MLNLCFAASSGGHYEQLMMLKPLMEKHRSFIVTEKTKYQAKTEFPTYYLYQVNRKEIFFFPKMIANSFLTLRILMKEKPDAIICTGVVAMIPLCLLAKMMKKKLVYLESFAKVKTPTISGKFLYPFVDRFYVQWEDMLKIFPEAVYKGGIY